MFPRKHKFTDGSLGGTCKHCQKSYGLNSWQLKTMPKEMALCESKEAPRMSIWDWLDLDGVDCT